MYTLQYADSVTMEEILSKVTQEQLWKYYCPNFEQINKNFLSDFYNDTMPSCRVISNKYGKLYYKDFGTGQYISNIFDYVKFKYNCTYQESLNIIANDFNIRKIKIQIDRTYKGALEDKLLIKPKSNIQIVKKAFTLNDYNNWSKYHISLALLDKYEVFACDKIILNTNTHSYEYQYLDNNPIYSYTEYDINLNYIGSRIYFPNQYKTRKWLNDSTSDIIQGIKQLPENGDLLIITKSLKDIMVLNVLGYNAISLASETTPLKEEIFNNLKQRFKKIIILYDNDETGIKYSNLIKEKYDVEICFIPSEYNCKDISELIVYKGLEISKKVIQEII